MTHDNDSGDTERQDSPERQDNPERRGGPGRSRASRGPRGPRGPRRPGGGRRLDMMRRRLDLTDEQVATLREKFAEHRAQGLAIVRDVLDDEQRARFDRHLDRRRSHGRRHGGRHGGHGGRHESDTITAAAPTDTAPTDAA